MVGHPQTDATRVNANLHAIRTLGGQCEDQLRQGRGDPRHASAFCQRFLARLAPTGDYNRIIEKAQLLAGDPGPGRAPMADDMRPAQRINDEIVRSKGIHDGGVA